MNRIYINTNEYPELWQLARIAGYTGKKLLVEACESELNLNSYWSEGSRDYFTFIDLNTKQTCHVPQNGTVFDRVNYKSKVPVGFCCVETGYFCGKPSPCIIYFNPVDITKRLHAPKSEVTEDEETVLWATRRFKSSYAGRSDNRFQEAHSYKGITLDRWNVAKASCIEKKLLNKAGAITVNGKNALV